MPTRPPVLAVAGQRGGRGEAWRAAAAEAGQGGRAAPRVGLQRRRRPLQGRVSTAGDARTRGSALGVGRHGHAQSHPCGACASHSAAARSQVRKLGLNADKKAVDELFNSFELNSSGAMDVKLLKGFLDRVKAAAKVSAERVQ
eukprot:4501960-Prymnesium_polylepis.2